MMHLRARAAVRLLQMIYAEDPQLFGRIKEFRESHQISKDLWDCLDCYNTDSLSLHGQCKRCGSEAVSPSSLQKVS